MAVCLPAVDNEGQVIDVFVSPKRDIAAATKFFTGALLARGRQSRLSRTGAALPNMINKLLPNVFHNTEQYANNRVECDHGRLRARLRGVVVTDVSREAIGRDDKPFRAVTMYFTLAIQQRLDADSVDLANVQRCDQPKRRPI
jgi:transposase-like protein